MNLIFQRKINDRPTNFRRKIQAGLVKEKIFDEYYMKDIYGYIHPSFVENAKIHTIRDDKKNRWKIGTKIHFQEWLGRPYHSEMYRFAPIIPVTNIQNINIKWNKRTREVFIRIDNQLLSDAEVVELSKNDGFDNVIDFLEYFNGDFNGKIIHWTYFAYISDPNC